MHEYKAVIFDLDGTLANTLSSIAYFANNSLSLNGLPEIEPDKYRFLVGRGAKNLVKAMLDTVAAPNSDALLERVYSMYSKSYDDNFGYLTEEYDGISEMLAALTSLNLKLGVLSNKPHNTTVKLVEKLFPNTFDLCLGHREGYERKPNPSVLIDMIKQLGISSEQCVFVGDTSTDMRTGKSANAFTVGVEWGFRDRSELEEFGADLIISSPNELVKFICG